MSFVDATTLDAGKLYAAFYDKVFLTRLSKHLDIFEQEYGQPQDEFKLWLDDFAKNYKESA